MSTEKSIEKILEENEMLKSSLEDAYHFKQKYFENKSKVNILEMENKQLREALRKCNPYGNYIITSYTYCKFCDKKEFLDHAEDCEYVKLTQEGEK